MRADEPGTPTVWSAIKRQKRAEQCAQRSQDKSYINDFFEVIKALHMSNKRTVSSNAYYKTRESCETRNARWCGIHTLGLKT